MRVEAPAMPCLGLVLLLGFSLGKACGMIELASESASELAQQLPL